MSGWIKMGVGLRRHPKVVRLAGALKADRLRVIGALHAVWCVFDEHSQSGRLDGYTSAVMDEEIGWRGFSKAMQGIGWLEEDANGLVVPDYEEHNGPTAKRRALDNKRKGESRSNPDDGPPPESGESPPDVRIESGQVSASDADKTKNREEKRREEKKRGEGEGRASAPARPESVSAEVWADWLTLRRAKKAPVTATVLGNATEQAAQADMSLEAFLRVWCARGSQGLQADWLKPHERPGAHVVPINKQEALEASNRAVGQRWAQGDAA